MGLVRRTAEQPSPPPTGGPDTLVAALDSADPEQRRRAALDLDGVASAAPQLLEHLAAEPDQAVRDAVLTVLAAHDSDEVARGLVPHLSSEDAALRTAVVEALATMTHAVPPLLPQLTTHPDHDVRILTAMLLADLAHPVAVTWLVDMVHADAHPNVVAAAIDALLPLATEEHIPLLERALVRFPDDPFLRFTVQSAIPRITGAHT